MGIFIRTVSKDRRELEQLLNLIGCSRNIFQAVVVSKQNYNNEIIYTVESTGQVCLLKSI